MSLARRPTVHDKTFGVREWPLAIAELPVIVSPMVAVRPP